MILEILRYDTNNDVCVWCCCRYILLSAVLKLLSLRFTQVNTGLCTTLVHQPSRGNIHYIQTTNIETEMRYIYVGNHAAMKMQDKKLAR